MKKVQLVLVTADDWAGLYVNGKLTDEGHSLPFRDIMTVLDNHGGRLGSWHQVEAVPNWMDGRSNLPDTLAECELTHPIPDGLIYK